MTNAARYPAPGSVMVGRKHVSQGPTGWHGNRHNDAVGWYWFMATTRDQERVESGVFKHRAEAEADAERRFLNIIGWSEGNQYRYAKVPS